MKKIISFLLCVPMLAGFIAAGVNGSAGALIAEAASADLKATEIIEYGNNNRDRKAGVME